MTVPGWREIARAMTASGDELVLRERAGSFEIRCNGWDLMSSRAHFSEERMAEMACERLTGSAPRVLIGGLGMGYTLRAALDHVPATAEVVVAELLPELIAWNRNVLGPLAGHPLDDARVTVVCGDVADLLRDDGFDAIVLDVDNGPDAVMLRRNAVLYTGEGLQRLRRALRSNGSGMHPVVEGPGRAKVPPPLEAGGKGEGYVLPRSGVVRTPPPVLGPLRGPSPQGEGGTSAMSATLAVWSADRSLNFEHRLTDAGFRWTRTDIPARGGPDDPLHTIYLGHP